MNGLSVKRTINGGKCICQAGRDFDGRGKLVHARVTLCVPIQNAIELGQECQQTNSAFNKSVQIKFAPPMRFSLSKWVFGAMKLTEYCPVNATLVVYHQGQHRCIIKDNKKREQKAWWEHVVESALQSNFKAKPHEIMLCQVTYFLSQGMEDEAEKAPLLLGNTKTISNIRASHLKKLFSTERHSFSAIANVKQKLDPVDPFLIYKCNGDNSTGVPKYAYKTSWDMAMLALELNRLEDETTSPLEEECLYFDCMHNCCKDFKTFTLWTYSPVIWKLIRIAMMEAQKEDSENITLFLSLFLKKLQKTSKNPIWNINQGGF